MPTEPLLVMPESKNTVRPDKKLRSIIRDIHRSRSANAAGVGVGVNLGVGVGVITGVGVGSDTLDRLR